MFYGEGSTSWRQEGRPTNKTRNAHSIIPYRATASTLQDKLSQGKNHRRPAAVPDDRARACRKEHCSGAEASHPSCGSAPSQTNFECAQVLHGRQATRTGTTVVDFGGFAGELRAAAHWI